jgi:hypothetical protein
MFMSLVYKNMVLLEKYLGPEKPGDPGQPSEIE